MTTVPVAAEGDWIEEPSADGSPRRRGLVVAVLGSSGHEHYRVRWDEDHESIHFPSPSMHVHRGRTGAHATDAGTRSS